MTDTRTHPDWPTQLSFPGQEAAPEGPVDMFMMYVMHHAFRRDLVDFAAAVPRTPAGERETWRTLQARWELFATVLHNHHSGEDAGLWPLLLERAEGRAGFVGRSRARLSVPERITFRPPNG